MSEQSKMFANVISKMSSDLKNEYGNVWSRISKNIEQQMIAGGVPIGARRDEMSKMLFAFQGAVVKGLDPRSAGTDAALTIGYMG